MFIRYPDAFVCRASGKHAAQYLQNRLTNDLRTLTPGKGACDAAALSPQGRIMAVVTVAVLAPDTFLLVAEGGDRPEILKALAQYRVAERVDFTDQSESFALIHCDGLTKDSLKSVFPDAADIPQSGSYLTASGTILISAPKFSASGIHAVVPAGDSQRTIRSLAAVMRELSGEALMLARVSKNVFSFPQELNSDLVLSEAGRADLVSFTKGCYVGQEVVAKIDALGRAPRTIVRFASASEEGPAAGEPLFDPGDAGGRQLGKVLTAVFDPARGAVIGFAILKSERAGKPGDFVAGRFPVQLLPKQS